MEQREEILAETNSELDRASKENERLKELLKLYAGCNVCVHHEDFNHCNEGGMCGGEKWQC